MVSMAVADTHMGVTTETALILVISTLLSRCKTHRTSPSSNPTLTHPPRYKALARSPHACHPPPINCYQARHLRSIASRATTDGRNIP